MLSNATKRLLQEHKMKIVTAVLTIAILSIATFFSYTAYAAGKKTVTFIEDGKKSVITTRANTVQELLAEQHVHLNKQHDAVQPSVRTALKDDTTVKWEPAHKIIVAKDGSKQTIWTRATTFAEMFHDNGITIDPDDTVTPNVDGQIQGNTNVIIKHGIKVALYDQNKREIKAKIGTTLDQFVRQQDIKLGRNDQVQLNDKLVPKDSKQVLKTSDRVYIYRVTEKTIAESIDYKTVQRNDSSMEKGQTKILQSGQEGVVAETYKVTTATNQQGTHAQKELVHSRVEKEPKNKIIAVGTKIAPSTSTTSVNQGKELSMQSTAFTADCSGCRGVTSLGINLKSHPDSKVIAVDPNVIPLGSKVWVEGYGYAIAGDTGGGIHGNKIDVFFSSQSQANGWGLKSVKVIVLN